MEDKSRPALDWTQPIQTMTGQRAEVIGERWVSCPHSKSIMVVKLVCVKSPLGETDPYGNVHQISNTGIRMDSRTPENECEPFIRNVPKKIEGWALVKHYPDRGERGCHRIVGGDIIQSEAEAREFKLRAIKDYGTGCRLVRVEMTEV